MKSSMKKILDIKKRIRISKNNIHRHKYRHKKDEFNIFKEKNPIKIIKKENPTTKEYDYNCNLFIIYNVVLLYYVIGCNLIFYVYYN